MLRYPQIHCAIVGICQANFGDKQTSNNFINILMGLHARIGKEGYRLHAGPWSTTQGTTQQEYKTKSFLSFSKNFILEKNAHVLHSSWASSINNFMNLFSFWKYT